jgi:hypothetical protein
MQIGRQIWQCCSSITGTTFVVTAAAESTAESSFLSTIFSTTIYLPPCLPTVSSATISVIIAIIPHRAAFGSSIHHVNYYIV